MVKEFSDLMDSFSFTRPTHEKRHTLDLVFSLGLSMCDVDVNGVCISDHMPVTFSVNVLNDMRAGHPSYVIPYN